MEAATPMHNKICMVTGANSGVGKATTLELAKLGVTVVLICRDQKRGELPMIMLPLNDYGRSARN